MNDTHWTIAIGASASGVNALLNLVSNLPAEFPATLLFAWHASEDQKKETAALIQKYANMKVHAVSSSAFVECGVIYVPARGGHLEMQADYARFYREKWSQQRPEEVDQLFLSMAQRAGSKCIGVLLSDLNGDGMVGLQEIHRNGGICVFEQGVPILASAGLTPDFCGPTEEIGEYLARLLKGETC